MCPVSHQALGPEFLRMTDEQQQTVLELPGSIVVKHYIYQFSSSYLVFLCSSLILYLKKRRFCLYGCVVGVSQYCYYCLGCKL